MAGRFEEAILRDVRPGQVLRTPSQAKPFKVGRVDRDGLELLMGQGEWPVRLTWECINGIEQYLAGAGLVAIGGRHSSVPNEGTLDGYLKHWTPVTTAGWVASVLEAASLVRIIRERPALVELIDRDQPG